MIITNATAVRHGNVEPNTSIIIENGVISAILSRSSIELSAFDRVIDAKGMYVSAGFIELHTHGVNGYDFMDAEPKGFLKALRDYPHYGVTGVYPTTMSAPFNDIETVLDSISATDLSDNNGATFLGIHLEGPYFSPAQCGAQPASQLRVPSDGVYKRLIDKYDFISRIDAAPELDGAFEMAEILKGKNIVAGIAHTDAASQLTLRAIDAGYSIATHLYSGMSAVHRENGFRYGGTVEACLLNDNVYTEAICDGIHLPAELLQLIYKVKGDDRMILVTDSNRGADLPEGSHCVLGNKDTGLEVIVSEGVAWIPDKTAFAGSIATYDRLIRTAVNLAGIPLPNAVKMATETPAKAMGLKNKGSLDIGFDADITIFDENINIQLTIVGGNVVYEIK